MSRPRLTFRRGLLVSVVAALTCWIALFAWRGFASDEERYIGPLFTFGLAMAGLGALARWARVPWPLVPLLQVALLGTWLLGLYSGHGLMPTSDSLEAVGAAFRDAVDSANAYRAPVPRSVPTVTPLLVAGGGACLILIDLLAAGLGRVPLAGLPLLLVYSLPISISDTSLPWPAFVMVAAGFLALLFLREDERFSQWGRQVYADPRDADPAGFGVRTGSARSNAVAIGSTVTAMALFVPAFIPELEITLFGGGAGSGDGPGTGIVNPMTDLRTDLRRGTDDPLLLVTTDDPRPSYLKLAVLTNFNGEAWTTGDRRIPDSQVANGADMPPLPGLSSFVVEATPYDYTMAATDELKSTWLPVPEAVTSANAPGVWKYDISTRDFLSSESTGTTEGLSWTTTGVDLDYDVNRVAAAQPAPVGIDAVYTTLPTGGIPEMAEALAVDITSGYDTDYEKAVALQNWFRVDGKFTYDTEVDPGNGSSNLTEFLAEDGRRGYCEQFASAFAVMARFLDLPARVVVGFLNPDQVRPGVFEFSAHDLHAWPEVYFEGAGWMRFEPTPGNGARVPAYTRDVVSGDPSTATPTATPTGEDPTDRPTASLSPNGANGQSDSARVLGFPWLVALGVIVGLLVLVALAFLPQLLRRNRRRLRWSAGTAEAAWAELRDSMLDLRLEWPRGRSPAATGAHVSLSLAAVDGSARPALGREANPEAAAALDRLVGAVELERYSGRALVVDPAELESDVLTCVAALSAGVSTATRRRAHWLPRSLRGTRPGTEALTRVRSARDNVVDHVS